MLKLARAFTVPDADFLMNMKAGIIDRDHLFSVQLRTYFDGVNCEPKVRPPHSPNLNAYVERFIGTVRREGERKITPLSTDHLEFVLREYIATQ